jgi:hypothetical protein
MFTPALCELNAVVKKHPNVKAAKTVKVNAKIVLALAKTVFIFAKYLVYKKTNTHDNIP